MKKLFGHNNEVVSMTLSSCGKYLASSSKARYSHNCFLLVWSAETYEVIATLPGHESTVVCLAFSPDSKYLASSGKDRSLCIYEKQTDTTTGGVTYIPILCMKNIHKRIVWDLNWSSDGGLLATVARDGICKVWKIEQEQISSAVPLSCIHSFNPFQGQAITAIAIGQKVIVNEKIGWLVVLGSEAGDLQLCTMHPVTGECHTIFQVPAIYSHGKTVKKLKWRPRSTIVDAQNMNEWASCGEDNSVRIHRYRFL